MSDETRDVVVGVFEDRRHAMLAVEELGRNGFAQDQIGFVIPDHRPIVEPLPKRDEGTKVGEGTAAGVASGGVMGGLVGAALASAIIPGVGPIIAGGVLAGVAAGAIAGVLSGGLVGALVGLSVPEKEAQGYEAHFHSGRTLVTVHAGDRRAEAEEILRRAAEAPEQNDLHPGARAASLSESHGPGPGSGSVFPGA